MCRIKWNALWLCFVLKLFPQVLCMEIVQFTVPETIMSGEHVTLHCKPDEFDNNTVTRWYLNGFLIYKYDPNDNPRIVIFPFSHLIIDRKKSSQFHITLNQLIHRNSGEYTCEISAGPPLFSVATANRSMLVLDKNYNPLMVIDKNLNLLHDTKFTFGDTFEAVCLIEYYPVNVTWVANGKQYEDSRFLVKDKYQFTREHYTISTINITIDDEIMKLSKNGSTILLECRASIRDIYNGSTHLEINVQGFYNNAISPPDEDSSENFIKLFYYLYKYIIGVLIICIIVFMILKDTK